MNTEKNVRRCRKALRGTYRSYNAPPKGWGKDAAVRASRRLGKAEARNY